MDVRYLIMIIRDRKERGLMTEQQGQDFLMAWDAVQNAELEIKHAEERARKAVHRVFRSFETPHEGIDFSSVPQLEFDLLKLFYMEKFREKENSADAVQSNANLNLE